MNVEIGAEAAQFPGKEYINGIAVAVCDFTTDEPGRRSIQHPAVSLQVRLIHASLGTGHILQPGPASSDAWGLCRGILQFNINLLSFAPIINMFAWLGKFFLHYRTCSLRFDIEKSYYRRFDTVAITGPATVLKYW
jgi:hypothetical protein